MRMGEINAIKKRIITLNDLLKIAKEYKNKSAYDAFKNEIKILKEHLKELEG